MMRGSTNVESVPRC